MMASVAKEPFDSPDWIFETKLDGYRAIAVIDSSGKANIWSRNRLPLEPKFPMVRDAVDQLKLRSTILDGEIVALDPEGVPRFQLLQQWRKRLAARLLFCGKPSVPRHRLAILLAMHDRHPTSPL
jgi:bifunctional non-homologous end joining protein LigD